MWSSQMDEQKNKCCLCDKQADCIVERKTFVEHRCVSIEYKPYCEEHYMHQRKEETNKQLSSKEAIKAERLRYLLGHLGTGASWNNFV